jgi:hypothetical protein
VAEASVIEDNSCNVSSDILNEYFSSLGHNTTKHITAKKDPLDYLPNRCPVSMFLTPVTDAEIISIVSKLPNKKSCGKDGISTWLIKKLIQSIVKPLCFIVNKSFLTGCFPNACKIAKVVPIFKSGDRSDYKNYRPISLLPCISKIFEKLMLIRVLKFLDNNAPLNKHQHGFRPMHSTITAMTEFLKMSLLLWTIRNMH